VFLQKRLSLARGQPAVAACTRPTCKALSRAPGRGALSRCCLTAQQAPRLQQGYRQASGSAESQLLRRPGARCRQDSRGTAAGSPPLRTCRRVCSTHCLRLPISCCVSPNRLIFFSATSTAFSISSTWASGSPCVQQCLTSHSGLRSTAPGTDLPCYTFTLVVDLTLQAPAVWVGSAELLPARVLALRLLQLEEAASRQ